MILNCIICISVSIIDLRCSRLSWKVAAFLYQALHLFCGAARVWSVDGMIANSVCWCWCFIGLSKNKNFFDSLYLFCLKTVISFSHAIKVGKLVAVYINTRLGLPNLFEPNISPFIQPFPPPIAPLLHVHADTHARNRKIRSMQA